MTPYRRLFAVGLAAIALQGHSQLVINELMQSNIDYIMDDLNEFPDSWVELYNIGSTNVNLADYALGTSDKLKKAYTLPAKTITPGERVVIYCDKEGSGMHASFRVESGKGCNVYLFSNGNVVDKVEALKKQPAPNIAYGRITDGADTWGYQKTPTPGAANCGSVCSNILGEPVFSQSGMVTSGSFSLAISLPEDAPEGTIIRYTTNGTEPVTTSQRWSGSKTISSTTTIRAKLFHNDYLSPRSTTHSYIFLGRDMTLPVVSIVSKSEYFYSNDMGILNNNNNGANARNDWRRPINLEYFLEPNSPAVINQLCETRVKGGATRSNPLKSMALYANKRFGEKRFYHEFFPEDAPGRSEWKSVELRNAGNDFDYLYLRDAAIQRNMGRRVDLDWQPWQPTIVLINGEYKGILNFRPRSNEDFIYTFYDGLEDVDLFENWTELKEGSWDNANAFKDFYNTPGHTFAEYNEIMDVSEFANLFIMQLYHNNLDFPGNNIVMWRPIADGGRWRWIAKDTDFGLGLYDRAYDYKMLDWLYNPNYDAGNAWANQPQHTQLFRSLMEVPDFKDMFIDRFTVYMGDFLNGATIGAELDEMCGIIRTEYKGYHRPLFNEWWPNYEVELNKAKKWANWRTPFFYEHLGSFYNLGTPMRTTVDIGRNDEVTININGVDVHRRWFDGYFYPGRTMTIKATPATNDKVTVGWRVTLNNDNTTTTEYTTETLTFTPPASATVIQIESITGENTGIESVVVEGSDAPTEIYDLSGRRIEGNPTPGIYLVRKGGSTQKVIFK